LVVDVGVFQQAAVLLVELPLPRVLHPCRAVGQNGPPRSRSRSSTKGRSRLAPFFDPTPDERRKLDQIAAGIPGVQDTSSGTDLRWIPFLNERATPLENLTEAWADGHEVSVGTVTFPRIDPETLEAKLTALLASELGANPGNWEDTPNAPRSLPATRFTSARQLAYAASQQARGALPEAA